MPRMALRVGRLCATLGAFAPACSCCTRHCAPHGMVLCMRGSGRLGLRHPAVLAAAAAAWRHRLYAHQNPPLLPSSWSSSVAAVIYSSYRCRHRLAPRAAPPSSYCHPASPQSWRCWRRAPPPSQRHPATAQPLLLTAPAQPTAAAAAVVQRVPGLRSAPPLCWLCPPTICWTATGAHNAWTWSTGEQQFSGREEQGEGRSRHAWSALCALLSKPGPEEWRPAHSAPFWRCLLPCPPDASRASQFNVKRLQFVPTLFWVDTGEATCGSYGGQ